MWIPNDMSGFIYSHDTIYIIKCIVYALNKVVVAIHKCECPKENCWLDSRYKLCCYDIVIDVRLKGERLNPLTH